MDHSKQELTAILTIGIPGSGKTTWAEKFVDERNRAGENWWNINRDDIRLDEFSLESYNDYKFSRENEAIVTDRVNHLISMAVEDRANIVKSDTNLNTRHREDLVNKLEGFGYRVEYRLFPIEYKVACERVMLRKGKTVDSKVIWDFHKKYLEYVAGNTNQDFTEGA